MLKRRIVNTSNIILVSKQLNQGWGLRHGGGLPLAWDKGVIMEVNGDTACKSYLIVCHRHRRAALIDPIKPRIANYLGLLAYHNLRLDYAFDSHTHADHITASFELSRLTGAKVAMHRNAPAPLVDQHVEEGDIVQVGDVGIKVMHTPGHTPDSISLHLPSHKVVLPGDLILIGGTGRTDFAGGNPGQSYDSIQRILELSDDTILLPNHDYRGNSSTTVGHEKRTNPRFAGKTKEEYVHIMNNLGLPLPEKIMEALQTNMTATVDSAMQYPTISQLNQVHQMGPELVHELIYSPVPVSGMSEHEKEQEFLRLFHTELTEQEMRALISSPPVVLDVRLEDECKDKELPQLPGSINIPLSQLPKRVQELEQYRDRAVVCICRAGVRSTTAAALLKGLGFASVFNLKGGMLAWKEKFRHGYVGHLRHKK